MRVGDKLWWVSFWVFWTITCILSVDDLALWPMWSHNKPLWVAIEWKKLNFCYINMMDNTTLGFLVMYLRVMFGCKVFVQKKSFVMTGRVSYRYTTGQEFWHYTCNHGYHTCHRYGYIPNRKFCGVRWYPWCHSYPQILFQKWYSSINKMATTLLLQQYHHLNQITHISSWSLPSQQLKHPHTKSNCYGPRNQDARMLR